jgi:hypothetical protein
MVNKFLKPESGMTLVEVMVAGSIGVAVFLYINQAIVRMNKSQTRFERKEMARVIKKNMQHILEDTDSWISNPESDIPRGNNDSNYYYFKSPGADISKVSFTPKEIVAIDNKINPKGKDWKCPKAFEDCRVFLWSYRNELITEENINKLSKHHFRVLVATVTDEKHISRAYLPEFKVILTDTNSDTSLSARSAIFHVNATGSKKSGKSGLVEINGKKIDILSRKKCFLDFLKVSSDRLTGLTLCKEAESLAPSQCYRYFKRDKKLPSDIALIACVNSKNSMPQECFKEAKRKYKAPDTHLAILCSAAKSMMPFKCLDEIKSYSNQRNNIGKFKVCSRAEDLTPAICFNSLMENSRDNLKVALELCPQHK